MGKTQVPHIL